MPRLGHRRSPGERLLEQVAMCPTSGCWLFTGHVDARGYGVIGVPPRTHNDKAHRVAWREFRGTIPDGLWVLHKCDVRCCVNPGHLFLGTNADNMRDMWRKERHARHGAHPGADHHGARLSADDVRFIRAAYGEGYSQNDLARRFGIAQSHVSKIVLRKQWQHI